MTVAHDLSAATAQLRGGGRRHDRRGPGSRGPDGRRRRGVSGWLLALIVLIVLFLLMLALPALLGYGTLVVLSGSMQETAPVGSLVVARPLDTKDVRVGDVILVRRDGPTPTAPVLHRIISLTHRQGDLVVTTKGDSNATPDPTPYKLTGTTMTPVLALPHVGRAYAFVHTPLGWVLLIALPATMLLWVELRTIWFPVRRAPAHRSQGSRRPARRGAAHRSAASRRPPEQKRASSPIPNDHAPAAI